MYNPGVAAGKNQ